MIMVYSKLCIMDLNIVSFGFNEHWKFTEQNSRVN